MFVCKYLSLFVMASIVGCSRYVYQFQGENFGEDVTRVKYCRDVESFVRTKKVCIAPIDSFDFVYEIHSYMKMANTITAKGRLNKIAANGASIWIGHGASIWKHNGDVVFQYTDEYGAWGAKLNECFNDSTPNDCRLFSKNSIIYDQDTTATQIAPDSLLKLEYRSKGWVPQIIDYKEYQQ